MPALNFDVTWPDGETSTYYSPSTVLKEHLQAPCDYPLDEFLKKSRTALQQASDRVSQKYGFACSAAADELRKIEHKATSLKQHAVTTDAEDVVVVHNIY